MDRMAVKQPQIRSNYDYQPWKGLDKFDSSKTKQSFKEECDINNILARYQTTGVLPDLILENPQYGDFSEVPDYHQALNLVSKAHEQFASLDAQVRSRFDNDPAKFLDFATNPQNTHEMVKMGLAVARPTETTSSRNGTDVHVPNTQSTPEPSNLKPGDGRA